MGLPALDNLVRIRQLKAEGATQAETMRATFSGAVMGGVAALER